MSEGSEDERATVEFEHTAGTLDMRAFGYRTDGGDLLIGSVGGKAIGKETTMTLTEFLLARLEEDEAKDEAKAADWLARPEGSSWQTQWLVARVLADVEAKRRVVELASAAVNLPLGDRYDKILNFGRIHDGASVLQALAQPYADHPDFREEWRP